MLARAFHDQPLDRAVVGGSAARRLRVGRAGMRASLAVARGRAHVRGARRADRLEGVLLALPPYAYPLPTPPVAAQVRTLLRQGFGTARRWREVWDVLDARHPPEPCWYLSLLGVEPEAQRRGTGTALLEAWLAVVSAEGQPAWLETSRRENVALYRRWGFDVADELSLFGVPVWLMARPAV